MKWFVSIIIITSCNGCAFATLPASKFTVHVTDMETGLPITHAVIKTGFEHKYDPWGGGKNIVDRRKERVDKEGMVVFSGKDIGGSFGAAIRAEGYYQDWAGLERRKKNLVLNRWEPWNPTFEVQMRPKKNPVPMVHKKVFRIKPPENGKSIGFDLEKADWVSPYGKGITSDFIFNVSLSESPKKGAKYTLSFSNETDGIQEYLPPEEFSSSEFKWPYEAPLASYEQSMSRFAYYMFPNPDLPGTDLKSPINYIFRVRSRELEDGTISGAYGFIKGEIQVEKENALYFTYWFNPIPNERSLEYSGENLLKK